MSRCVWIIAIILLLAIGGGIGVGKSDPEYHHSTSTYTHLVSDFQVGTLPTIILLTKPRQRLVVPPTKA